MKYIRFIQLALSHPSWAFWLAKEVLSLRLCDRDDYRHRARLHEYDEYLTSPDKAIADITQFPFPGEVYLAKVSSISVLSQSESNCSSIPVEWNCSPEFALIIYTICRMIRPLLIIETGVAQGRSSFYILQALHENGLGHLYSIDLPMCLKAISDIGCLVPKHLRSRWTLRFGVSEYILPKILREVASPVDLFICDSSHTYRVQLREYKYALSSLRPGGVLISDDVGNDAFMEIAEAYHVTPLIVPQSKELRIGILVKP